jgi:general secretion pathway protein D
MNSGKSIVHAARFRSALAALLLAALAGCANDTLHRQGLDFVQEGRVEEGLAALEQAAREAPGNFGFRADYIRERDRAIAYLLGLGERAVAAGRRDEAAAYYQRVLALDGENAQARAGLAAIVAAHRHDAALKEALALLDKGELGRAQSQLQAILLENPGHAEALEANRQIEARLAQEAVTQPALTSKFRRPVNLQFRDANIKQVFEALSRSSGINVLLDKDVRSDLKTTIFVKDASVEDSIDLILMQNQLEKKILNDNTVFVYPNTPAKTKEYKDLVIRTFHFTNADAKQMLTMIKTLLKTKDIFIHEKNNSLVMRDTPEAVRLAEKLVAGQDLNDPEVMLEVEVLEVLRSKLTELGIQWPGSVGLSVSGTPATSTTTTTAGGAIVTDTTPAGDLTLEALQHLNASDIKVTPLTATVNLRKEVGDSNLLASPRIRVRQRDKAKILIGDRVPVITNSVTPVSTGAPVVTGQVQYLDVGLKLEVEPDIHMDGEVAIKTFLEVSSIVREVTNATSGTVAFQIGTRTATTVLRLKDGETQVLAGLISDEDRQNASKVPGLGDIPLLGRLFSSHKNDARKTEIILSITPHIVRNMRRPDADVMQFWSGTDATLRSLPLSLRPVGMVKTGSSGEMTQAAARPARQPPRPPAPQAAPADTAADSALVLSMQGATQARVGETFQLVVQAQAGGRVASVPLQIGFDAAALEVVEVGEGDFLKQGNAQTNFTATINQPNGQIDVENAQDSDGGASGRGSLARITFRVTAARPQSQISVSVPLATDAAGSALVVTLPAPHNLTLNP